MKEIFADTFYFIALLNPSDVAHSRARSITAERSRVLVTTAWVLTELANSLSHHESRGGFLRTLEALSSDETAVIVGPEPRWYDAGVELYRNRSDKDWSLTDCISFVVMKERGIQGR